MSDESVKKDDEAPEEPKAEEPKAEEPKAEEPKAEEPKAEEPKAEEPKAEEPKAEEPKAEEPKAEEPKAEVKLEESKAEEPKAGVKVEGSPTVCPFCKDRCGPEVRDGVVCQECLTRHHSACWDEGGSKCSSCGSSNGLKGDPGAEPGPAAKEAVPAEPEPVPAPAEPGPGPVPPEPEPEPEPAHAGLLIEFETTTALMTACEKVRDAGFTKWDAHTPFPVHGLDKAMGIKPTILPWIAFGGGLTGATVGVILQVYTNGYELPFSLLQQDNWLISEILSPFIPSGYPYITSGKPIMSIPAYIPVIFELTILLAAFGSFFGMLGLNRLPQFWHPVFSSERFKRASSDRFFISIEAGDPLYHEERTRDWAGGLGALSLDGLEG